jgi:hypothetical protein
VGANYFGRASCAHKQQRCEGLFTDEDNQTGGWEISEGIFWTGGFWTGELWQMYARTYDYKYRCRAELWTSTL